MIKWKKFLTILLISFGMAGIFTLFVLPLSPRFLFVGKFYSASDLTVALSRLSKLPEVGMTHRFYVGTLIFVIVSIFIESIIKNRYKKIEVEAYKRPKTKIFVDFLKKLNTSYTFESFLDAVHSELEYAGDCAVMHIDTNKDIVLYNSPNRFVSDPEIFNSFKEISQNLKTGFYFFDSNLQQTNQKAARFIAVILEKSYLFIVCPYLNEVEAQVLSSIYFDFLSYQTRIDTLNKVLYISELNQEWNMVANTQRAFLPTKIPSISGLDIGYYFRPLLNVSGDYYDIIKITDSKTLVVLGDVSGKGLSAALIMGVVVNTIKIAKDKENLTGLIRAIDDSIKRMKLMDKYTVLFLGLIDTEEMKIRYINASMENPMILTEAPNGYKVKFLESTCSIVGIIGLDNIHIEEKNLYRGDIILMTTDGVSEITNSEGIELGETDLYLDSIKEYAPSKAGEIVDKIANLAISYVGDAPLKDDITMLCVKVEG